MKKGSVYLIKNKINGKGYIGKSVQISIRFSQHKHCAFNPDSQHYHRPLYASMRKYGIENFEFIILEKNLTDKELLEKEVYWIEKLNTKSPNGYNLTDGGEGVSGRIYTEETRKHMSEAQTGRKHSEETKRKMSEYWKEHWRLNENTASKENGDKISKALKGRPKPDGFGEVVSKAQGKGVQMIDKNTNEVLNEFVSTYKAEEWLKNNTKYIKANFSKIAAACRGDRKTAYGYEWVYINN